MPELPEVEITRRGIEPHILDQTITQVIIRQAQLRWPIPKIIQSTLAQQVIESVARRGKYLLLKTQQGHLIIHLGMSGSLRIASCDSEVRKHDHFDLVFKDFSLRLHDPRRFGSVLWTKRDPMQHKLLVKLGPEPLSSEFTAKHLYQISRTRRVAVKEFIMNSHVVVGVGNIYATEALFMAGINPKRAAGNVSLQRYVSLTEAIKTVLTKALACGGTTLRDFSNERGQPGYFSIELQTYGRAQQPCVVCAKPLSAIKQGQRTTTYCKHCQK
jgi:formamidopyrimidine-DNA glycosylase